MFTSVAPLAWFEGSNPLFFGQFSAGLFTYIVISVCLFKIASDKREENAWFAFVPVLNLLLLARLAKMNWLWLLTFFFPPVGIFVAVYMLMQVAQKAEKSSFWGILMCIPCIQLLAWPYVAFSRN